MDWQGEATAEAATTSPVYCGLASRADQLRLPILFHDRHPLEQGRGCGRDLRPRPSSLTGSSAINSAQVQAHPQGRRAVVARGGPMAFHQGQTSQRPNVCKIVPTPQAPFCTDPDTLGNTLHHSLILGSQ